MVYIIERLEHGNCGVYGAKTLDKLNLEDALKKTPYDYGVTYTMWGFWPVISETEGEINDILYRWNDDEGKWEADKINVLSNKLGE